uniref:Putative secreted protein n=1 Tax=Ixodes ricinus TaxID=34613 RepID=A0A6B0U7V5_IXORI
MLGVLRVLCLALLATGEAQDVLLTLAQEHFLLPADLVSALLLLQAHFTLVGKDLALFFHDAKLFTQQPGLMLVAVVLHFFLELAALVLELPFQELPLLLLQFQ